MAFDANSLYPPALTLEKSKTLESELSFAYTKKMNDEVVKSNNRKSVRIIIYKKVTATSGSREKKTIIPREEKSCTSKEVKTLRNGTINNTLTLVDIQEAARIGRKKLMSLIEFYLKKSENHTLRKFSVFFDTKLSKPGK